MWASAITTALSLARVFCQWNEIQAIKKRFQTHVQTHILFITIKYFFLYYRGPFETIQIICAVVNISKVFPKMPCKEYKHKIHIRRSIDFFCTPGNEIKIHDSIPSPLTLFGAPLCGDSRSDQHRPATMKGIWKVGENNSSSFSTWNTLRVNMG